MAINTVLPEDAAEAFEEVPLRGDLEAGDVIALLTIARFCEPSSELHIETTWYRRTALDDLLGVPPERVYTDRLYEGLDQLLPHKEAIERHLKARIRFQQRTVQTVLDWAEQAAPGDVAADQHLRIALALYDDRQRKTQEIPPPVGISPRGRLHEVHQG
jgi:hypothetical protein